MNQFGLNGGGVYPNEPAWEPPAPRVQRTQHLWVPGDFPSNNMMLAAQRAEGFNAGLRHYERARQTRVSPAFKPHATRVQSIRQTVAARARRDLEPVPPERWSRLAFYLLGHHRYDADAWYLAAKHAADGLQDAGIIGRDGAGVHSTEGRCAQSVEESIALWERSGGVAENAVPMGLLIEVSPWG